MPEDQKAKSMPEYLESYVYAKSCRGSSSQVKSVASSDFVMRQTVYKLVMSAIKSPSYYVP